VIGLIGCWLFGHTLSINATPRSETIFYQFDHIASNFPKAIQWLFAFIICWEAGVLVLIAHNKNEH